MAWRSAHLFIRPCKPRHERAHVGWLHGGAAPHAQANGGAFVGADVVGDLDIEIKLDKPGQVRLNLFSHSADDYTSYLDNTQRNGVGITYQREFNTFKEFFRSLFMTRKKREQMSRSAPQDRDLHHMMISAPTPNP